MIATEKPFNRFPVAVAMGLILIILGSTMSFISEPAVPDYDPFRLVIDVEVQHPDGTVSHTCKENDVMLRNFAYFLMDVFSGAEHTTTYSTYVPTDTLGNNQPLRSGTDYIRWGEEEARIHIGDGVTPVALTNYALANEITNVLVSAVSYSATGLTYNVTLLATWNPAMAYTIRETGLSGEAPITNDQILMCRDVIASPVTVGLGDVVTLRYIFVFNVVV